MAIVLGLFPKERHGRAIAVWGLSAMLAPAIGPSIGGWLVTSVSWHWLFLINVPIGIATFVCSIKLIPETGHRERRPFDTVGLVLGCGGLTLAVLGLSEANRWGWGTAATIGSIGLGVVSLGLFVRWELRVTHPMIELRMFRERNFRFAMSALLFVYIAQFGRLVFLPLQLEELRGDSALKVGLLFILPGAFTAVSMALGGRLVDRIGPRTPIMVGSALVGVAMIGFAFIDLDTSLLFIDSFMCVQGFGIGLLTAPAMVAGLSELPPNLMAQGTAMRSLLSQVGGALAVAVLGAVLAARVGTSVDPHTIQSGYDAAFAAAAVGVGVAFVLASRLPKRVDATAIDGAALAIE
jgi:EmrB/QacA subfamily drug resistance transporter